MTKRLFTFGDSFCKYVWPMWPEIMAQGYDETINYGLSGVGNFFIFSKFIYLYNTKNLGPNDTVIIQWTEPARFDYINPNEKEWAREGSASAEKFIRPEIEQLNSDPTTYYKTLTYMQTIINMLKSKGCKWYFFFISWESMVPKIGVEESFRGAYQNSTQVNYDTMLDIVNTHTDKHFVDEVSMVEYINPMFDGNNLICQSVDVDGSLVEFVDGHPTPVYFYQYIRDVIAKKIPDLDLIKMEKFSIETENLLRAVCPNKKYNPNAVGSAMDQFYRENTNYKNTIQTLL